MAPFATALEVALVYAGILLYIWRWQFSYPRAWVALWSIMIISHIAHRDSLRSLGLTIDDLRSSAQLVLPIALALYFPLLIYGFAQGSLILLVPAPNSLVSIASYGIWCCVQQYVAQSYFHNRLMRVVNNRHLSSLLVGIMFGATHIPNPILMVATTLGGILLAEVFARHRNIWPLALAQAVGGFLIATISPPWLIHNMRVGPGYFFFGLR